MSIDPWILTFSAVTVIITVWMGFWSAKKSKTASDFFVAGRSVSVGWNASAISGEYLSAASFMGVAGMVMSSGYDALWYPVCYACGYLFLLLFIAGPLRRFGAYTIPDFAEGRFDSPLFRKIAVVFVLFIGFFYTMPQMKGAGTTLSYIFPGLPYWAGVVLVGAVITLNVALGGMKGITLVQAFQYWAKMFAISVPVFVLMAVYGHYGNQLKVNNAPERNSPLPPGIDFKAKDPADELTLHIIESKETVTPPPGMNLWQRARFDVGNALDRFEVSLLTTNMTLGQTMSQVGAWTGLRIAFPKKLEAYPLGYNDSPNQSRTKREHLDAIEALLTRHGLRLFVESQGVAFVLPANEVEARLPQLRAFFGTHKNLPAKAPRDDSWLNPFGPLTTKAAKAAAAALTNQPSPSKAALPGPKTASIDVNGSESSLPALVQNDFRHALNGSRQVLGDFRPALNGFRQVSSGPRQVLSDSRQVFHGFRPVLDGSRQVADDSRHVWREFAAVSSDARPVSNASAAVVEDPAAIQKAWLAKHEKPLALLYTYSLIIALVCGTAGLPHILVRFYTNPDGVAAKRTTMWVMILIGVFYLFPPVFGVMGRNLMPSLYEGAGAKGTDKVVLELPRLLNSDPLAPSPAGSLPPAVSQKASEPVSQRKGIPWGSILSGITCAGAFAAFMSTFSGLLVSMTGALAHDVYGRIFRPKSTPEQRMRMFKLCAVLCGAGAMLLGFCVESFEINKMVGWAFAIAATSYFPLLFLSTWWRGITMKGAATGMLVGGTLSLLAIASTMFADEAKWAAGLKAWYTVNPLWRILAEQPAIWGLPLALGLMFLVSKLTAKEVPADIRMKMLVLHAPEKLGLKQEYIQEHQGGH